MPMPAKVLMDELFAIRDMLMDAERYLELGDIDALIEAVNAAGHAESPSREECVRHANRVLESGHITLGDDVLTLVRDVLI